MQAGDIAPAQGRAVLPGIQEGASLRQSHRYLSAAQPAQAHPRPSSSHHGTTGLTCRPQPAACTLTTTSPSC